MCVIIKYLSKPLEVIQTHAEVIIFKIITFVNAVIYNAHTKIMNLITVGSNDTY
jgi:hypothetical protein